MSKNPERQLRMAVCLVSPLWAMVGWRNSPESSDPAMSLSYLTNLAKTSERGRIDFVLQMDKLIVHGLNRETFTVSCNSWPEPVTMASFLAAQTEHIGFSVTMSTTFNEPFNVARIMASLDHLSGGRASWNVVMSREVFEDGNFRMDHRAHGEDRGAQSQEFVDAVKALWDSWDDDAIRFDRDSGFYTDPDKVRRINHQGAWHSVDGPLNVSRPPQGHPVIVTAGLSERFRERAAEMADVIFTNFSDQEEAIAFTADVRQKMVTHNREPQDILVMPNFTFIGGETEKEAQKRLDLMTERSGPLIVEQVRQRGVVGSYLQIADFMESWWESGAVDGFTYLPVEFPDDLEIWADLIAPELQRRGVMPGEYQGKTLRENLGIPRPANPYTGVPTGLFTE